MSIFKKLSRTPKLFAAVAALLVAGAATALTFAWGPGRTTYTVEKPADKITFNSITNNPHVGDERNFVVVKDAANTADGGWQDNITVEPGKEYLVRVYVHNNAASSLNLTALNTRVTAALGTNTGNKVSLTGYISADNADPKQVWDDISFSSTNTFNMVYVPGSAKIYNNVTGTAGRALSDSIVDGSGALVGYEANDGKVPGCFQYASYVFFRVKPQFAPTTNFTVEKVVRKSGTTSWSESVSLRSSDTIQYRIKYVNTGAAQQDNVMVFDKLPSGVSYVPGSTKLYLGSDPANPRQMSDNLFTSGINIGSYASGGMAFIIFDAKITQPTDKMVCGTNTFKNIATVETNYGKKDDNATVTVDRACIPTPVKDIKVCDLTDNKVKTIKETEFDGKKHSMNLDDCKTPTTEQVRVCDATSGNIIIVNKDDASKYEPVDSEKCQKPVVIPSTGAEILGGLFGSSAVAYGAYAYTSSRRALRSLR